MTDSFQTRTRRPGDPAATVFDIVPDDDTDLDQTTTGLAVATPGTVRLTAIDGSIADVVIHPGTAFPIRARRVWATGTSATGIRGLA